MRFVSVVVPDWLIATIEGVAHVGAQPEARELGGGEGLDPEAPVGDASRRSAEARLWPATWAVP